MARTGTEKRLNKPRRIQAGKRRRIAEVFLQEHYFYTYSSIELEKRLMRVGRMASLRSAGDPLRQHRAAEIFQGRISMGVPSGTDFQISSISSLVTAMQPSVQSFRRWAAPT